MGNIVEFPLSCLITGGYGDFSRKIYGLCHFLYWELQPTRNQSDVFHSSSCDFEPLPCGTCFFFNYTLHEDLKKDIPSMGFFSS